MPEISHTRSKRLYRQPPGAVHPPHVAVFVAQVRIPRLAGKRAPQQVGELQEGEETVQHRWRPARRTQRTQRRLLLGRRRRRHLLGPLLGLCGGRSRRRPPVGRRRHRGRAGEAQEDIRHLQRRSKNLFVFDRLVQQAAPTLPTK